MPGKVLFVDKITRQDLKDHRKMIFAFGDNLLRYGNAGQARAMRGEYNAVGIATKFEPHRGTGAFYRDSDWPQVKDEIEKDFAKLTDACKSGRTVVLPSAGFGSGLARLELGSPLIYGEVEKRVWQVVYVTGVYPSYGQTLDTARTNNEAGPPWWMPSKFLPDAIVLRMIPYLSHLALAALNRFAPVGYPWFTDSKIAPVFSAYYAQMGGMTPSVSKRLGLSNHGPATMFNLYNSTMFRPAGE